MLVNAAIPLYLFAKVPQAGSVKTRLEPQIGSQQCEQLARQMLIQSAHNVSLNWPGRLVLCVTPTTDAGDFTVLADELGCEVILQSGDDLGDRMANALESGINQSGAGVVMGCDVPHCPGQILKEAWYLIDEGHPTVGPAADGGFYLLGMRQLPMKLFSGIHWGGDKVLSLMLDNASRLNMNFSQLETVRDIDLWEDLVWLAENDKRYQQFVS